jgi:stearoyl-CoA desaturase (Delta-9 desaturase)
MCAARIQPHALSDETDTLESFQWERLERRPMTQVVAKLASVLVPLAGVIVAIGFCMSGVWPDRYYLLLLLVGWIATGLGITVGFHRLLVHRSFETYDWLRASWVILGCMALQGFPVVWCAVHRLHHQREDLIGDPHTPHSHWSRNGSTWRGIIYAHLGWFLLREHVNPAPDRYAKDVLSDGLLMWVNRWYLLWVFIGLAIPAALGALYDPSLRGILQGLIWGGLIRVSLVQNITWTVNSLCHVTGRRPYRTKGQAGNVAILGVLALGEGWHNNHHAFPASPRFGLSWTQLDLGWMTIRAMQVVGLIWNAREPEQFERMSRRL